MSDDQAATDQSNEDGVSPLLQSAMMMHEMFVTYMAAGFTQDQSLRLIAYAMAASGEDGDDQTSADR